MPDLGEGIERVPEQEALEALAKIKQYCEERDTCENGCAFYSEKRECIFLRNNHTPISWELNQVMEYKLEW